MKKFITGAILAFSLSIGGCTTVETVKNSSFTTQLPIQYATLKLIEKSNRIDSTNVIETVKVARGLIKGEDQEIDMRFLANGVRASIDWESLSTADKVLISGLITEIETILDRQFDLDARLSEGAKIRIGTLLNYVETAAYMAQ